VQTRPGLSASDLFFPAPVVKRAGLLENRGVQAGARLTPGAGRNREREALAFEHQKSTSPGAFACAHPRPQNTLPYL